jgi:hypothetical protein
MGCFVVMIVGMPRPITRPIDKPVVPAPSPVDFLASNFVRSAPIVAQTAAANNIFNPFPSIAQAGLEGRNPTGAEAGLDAGFLAAGFLPVGKAASQLNSIVKRLNKSTDVGDFITPETMRYAERPNDVYEGLYRPGATGGFDYDNVPQPATPYTFGLVPTEKLSPLREFDRAAEPIGQRSTGPDNLKKIAEHLAEGGKLSDPTAVAYYPQTKWGYLAEGNHRLALAEALGLEQLPTRVWRQEYGAPPMRNFAGIADDGAEIYKPVGKRIGDLDLDQLALDRYSNFSNIVGERYIPPMMHPYLLKYFQPE